MTAPLEFPGVAVIAVRRAYARSQPPVRGWPVCGGIAEPRKGCRWSRSGELLRDPTAEVRGWLLCAAGSRSPARGLGLGEPTRDATVHSTTSARMSGWHGRLPLLA